MRGAYFSLAPLLRGEGWGEGLFEQLTRTMRRRPLTRNSSYTRSFEPLPATRGEVGKSPYAVAKSGNTASILVFSVAALNGLTM